ncbi:hypothetical protein N7476_005083 [Penicillium atrosanguineum]|uniref:Uncharacterized protein n=1 Tax=Penicillium atrosanguineum TaxID=1132637 RepID=A0A9W9PYQ5_9EURO|nr:hypothetical protein N7476_005083 [Penicillium atrosanguineum]
MSVQVIYDPDCDQNFPRLYHNQFQQWINANHQFAIHDGTVLGFDQAHVLLATASIPLQVPMTPTQFHMSLFACRIRLYAAKGPGTSFIGGLVAAQSSFRDQIMKTQTGEGR